MGRYELPILDEPTASMDMDFPSQQALFPHGGERIEQGDTERVLSHPEQEQTRRFPEFFGQ